MTKEIELVTQKVDYKKIIEMTLNKKDWGKVYTIFRYGSVKIDVCLSTFDFIKNIGIFQINVIYPEDRYNYPWINLIEVKYYMKLDHLENFEKRLLKSCITHLREIIFDRTQRKAKDVYSESHYYSSDITKEELKTYNIIKEYENIEKNMKESEFKEKLLSDIKYRIACELNKIFDTYVNEYVRKNKYVSDDFLVLLEQIEKLLPIKNDN